MKNKLWVGLAMVLVLAGGVFIGWKNPRSGVQNEKGPASDKGGRKIAYYQSPMHPWIKSDKPGNCTICGMKLVAIYEGDPGYAGAGNLLTLSSNSVEVMGVTESLVRTGKVVRTLRLFGTIDDDESKHHMLSATVDGRIEELNVHYNGAEVAAGQLLATFYSPALLAAEREYVGLRMSTAVSRELVEAARLRLRRLGLTDGQIEQLDSKTLAGSRTEILAPMSGTVVSKSVSAGQYVKEGERMFELADFSKMWFNAAFFEQDLGSLHPGQEVAVSTPSLPGKTWMGRIAFINPNLDEATRSGRARIELENPWVTNPDGSRRRQLLHRMSGEGLVSVESGGEHLVIPRRAILRGGADSIVFVAAGGGGYSRQKVRLGMVGDTEAEVLEGLDAEDKIVVEGNLMMDAQAVLNQPDAAATSGQKP